MQASITDSCGVLSRKESITTSQLYGISSCIMVDLTVRVTVEIMVKMTVKRGVQVSHIANKK